MGLGHRTARVQEGGAMRGNLDLPVGDRDEADDEPIVPEPEPEVPLTVPPPRKGEFGQWLKKLDAELEASE
jgi:hypothetical protein